MRLLARIHIKRTRRLHPEWTEAQLLEDVREVLVSMSDPRQEAMW